MSLSDSMGTTERPPGLAKHKRGDNSYAVHEPLPPDLLAIKRRLAAIADRTSATPTLKRVL